MKSTLKNLLAIITMAVIISSCGKKSADVLIPEGAAMVVHINSASLGSKLTWKDIQNSDWYKMATQEGPQGDLERKLMENPENSGINLNEDMYFFIQPSGRNAYAVFQGKLKDAKAFEAMVLKIGEGKEIKKDGDMNYAGEDGDFMTWNADRFMMVGDASGFNDMGNRGFPSKKPTDDSVLSFIKKVYKITSGGSIGSDSKFKSLMGEPGDMHVYVNSGFLTGNSLSSLVSLTKASVLFEGNISTFTLNFDNGKITGESKTYYNKEMGELYKKYAASNINTDMLKKIPGENVAAVIALNYPPEGLKAFLKLIGVDGLADSYMSKVGLSIDDFVKANKGDLLFAVTDFTVTDKEKTYEMGDMKRTYSSPEPDANILFATSINDKVSFDKMMEVGKNLLAESGEAAQAMSVVKYAIKDQWFIAGNKQESIDAFGTGGGKDHPFISKMSGHPMGMYLDLKKIMAGIQTKETGGMSKMLSGDANIWDNVLMYGGELKGGATVGHFEINMVDKNTNSLKQLNTFIGNMAKMYMGAFEGEANEFNFPIPDTTVPAPPSTPPPGVEIKPAN